MFTNRELDISICRKGGERGNAISKSVTVRICQHSRETDELIIETQSLPGIFNKIIDCSNKLRWIWLPGGMHTLIFRGHLHSLCSVYFWIVLVFKVIIKLEVILIFGLYSFLRSPSFLGCLNFCCCVSFWIHTQHTKHNTPTNPHVGLHIYIWSLGGSSQSAP